MGESALERCKVPLGDDEFAGSAQAGVPSAARRRQPAVSASQAAWREALLLTPLVLLSARAILPGGMMPAGLALILALAVAGVDHLFWYTLASLLSLLTVTTPLTALSFAPAYLLAAGFGQRWSARTSNRWLIPPTLALFCLCRFGLQTASTGAPLWAAPLEAILTGLLALILLRALPILRVGPISAYANEERLFFALIPLAFALLGLAPLTVCGLSLAYATGTFLVIFLAFLGGPGLGAAMGMLIAIAPGLFHDPWPISGALALGGFLTGLLRKHGKAGICLGFVCGFSLPFLVQSLGQLPSWRLPVQALIGLGVFLALPTQSLQHFTMTIPPDQAWSAAKRAEQARLRELLSDRVHALAGIFDQLSKAFVTRQQEIVPSVDLYALLDGVVRGHCQQCSGFDACWHQNFYTSYRELFDLMALAEMNGAAEPVHLRGRLAATCFQQHKLLEMVNSVIARVQDSQKSQEKTMVARDFVAGQLEGMVNIMTDLVAEMRLDVDFHLEVEERLRSSFNRLGLAVDSLSVVEYGQEMLEVRARKHGCLNYYECQYLIAPMVSRVLGHTFTVWEKHCPKDGACRDCSFTLVPSGRFQVRTAVGKIAKEPGNCGDNHTLMQTKDGRYAMVLSDGMGTGTKAAQESQATVQLLAQLLSTGLKEEFALNLINSVLMLRTPEERFATVDVALIDLFRGNTELIKVGAAPSYIKRGREVVSIRANTPPAGILREIEVDRQRYSLMVGDYLILVSDGIFSGALGPEETENWVERALARVEVAGPQPMVDFLLKLARTNMGETIIDDATVMVAQLLPIETF